MKYSFFIILFLPIVGISQDLIILKNGKDTIKCKIVEDKISILRYKNYNSTDSSVHQINQSEFDYYILQPKGNIPSAHDKKTIKDTSNYFIPPVVFPFYHFNVGFGVGSDYGGIGIRIMYLPVKYFAVFTGFGNAWVGFTFNSGISYRTLPDKKVCPYLSVMYGYNAIIQIKGTQDFERLYYGPSISIGSEFKSSRLKNFINFEVILPFRPKAYYDDVERLKHNPYVKIIREPLPIAISIGYHIVF